MRKTQRSLLALVTALSLGAGACALGRTSVDTNAATASTTRPGESTGSPTPAGAQEEAPPPPPAQPEARLAGSPRPVAARDSKAPSDGEAGAPTGTLAAPDAPKDAPRAMAVAKAPPAADPAPRSADVGALAKPKGAGSGMAVGAARPASTPATPERLAAADKRETEEAPARRHAGPRGGEDDAAPVEAPRQRSGLQGGSRDDVSQRNDYLRYSRDMAHVQAQRQDISQRVMISVRDDLEQGLPNASITVKHEGRTLTTLTSYANGKAQFFPRAVGLRGGETVELEVTSQGRTEKRALELAARDQEANVVVAALANRNNPTVDVMFVLDTTGSMGDEIARIQLTLLDVAARVKALEPTAKVRYGLTLYRDRGDEYVTRVTDFTTDVKAFLRELQAVEADGGGDTPEALNEGIYAAIHGASWTPANVPNALRVAILVADAPPHLDYEQDRSYAKEMQAAAARGIKIFPVAASGLDDQGEFIFRQMAHHTMARFVFITYGGGTSHHVGQFANNNLDDLVVGLLADELADLTGRSRAAVRALAMQR